MFFRKSKSKKLPKLIKKVPFCLHLLKLKNILEIPTNLICRGVQKLKSKDIMIDTEVECPDLEGTFDVNPYISDSPEVDC